MPETKEIFKVLNPERTFTTYNSFLEHFLPDLLPLYKGNLPKRTHRYFLLREEEHLRYSDTKIAVLQDVQTQEVFLVNALAIEKEGEYEYGA